MRYQEIIKIKQRVIRLLWTLSILILGLVLSGLLSPIGAQVTLCGDPDPLSPDPDGIYRLRGHLTCSDDPILLIEENGAEFDLRGFIATGDTSNRGIRIREGADNVIIVGGTFKNCKTALSVDRANDCEIEHFKAINSSGDAIILRGDDNSIVKSLCLKAGADCFQLRGNRNTAEWCTAIKPGGTEGKGQGIQFRGSGDAIKCSVFGGGGEGFQIQNGVSEVTIKWCVAIKNAKEGIEVEAGATGNLIKYNMAFSNGDGESTWDLTDGHANCDNNKWKRNKFKTSDPSCIK